VAFASQLLPPIHRSGIAGQKEKKKKVTQRKKADNDRKVKREGMGCRSRETDGGYRRLQ